MMKKAHLAGRSTGGACVMKREAGIVLQGASKLFGLFQHAMVRYGIVGVINVTVDAVGFVLLASGLGLPVALANAISFSSAIVVSYTLNSRWTFLDRSNSSQHSRQFLLFFGINLIGLALSTMLVVTFDHFMDKTLAKIASIPIIFFYNYFASSRLVFRRVGRDEGRDGAASLEGLGQEADA